MYNTKPNCEKFEDIKGVFRSPTSMKDGQHKGQKRTKGKTIIYKTLLRTLKIEKYNPY
jgi:hypothetical protein